MLDNLLQNKPAHFQKHTSPFIVYPQHKQCKQHLVQPIKPLDNPITNLRDYLTRRAEVLAGVLTIFVAMIPSRVRTDISLLTPGADCVLPTAAVEDLEL